MRARVLIFLAVVALVATVARLATHPPPRHTSYAGHLAYTPADVVEYFVFAAGPVVSDHPTLARPGVGTAKLPPAGELRAVAESVTDCIHSIDASAGPALAAAFNAADPQRLDSAVQRFNSAADRWLKAPYEQGAPCPAPPPPPQAPPDEGSKPGWWKVDQDVLGDYVLAGWLVAAGLVSVDVGAVFHVAVVAMALGLVYTTAVLVLWIYPVFLSYEFANMPTDLDRQNAIAKIAQTLRS